MNSNHKLVSWDTFVKETSVLADNLNKSKIKLECLVAVTRGGLFVAGMLSQFLNIRDIRTVGISSYSKDNLRTGNINYHFLSDFNPDISLVVDDLVDSGSTLKNLELFKRKQISPDIKLKTAVLYRKSKTTFEPDFFVENISADKWIVFPWEDK